MTDLVVTSLPSPASEFSVLLDALISRQGGFSKCKISFSDACTSSDAEREAVNNLPHTEGLWDCPVFFKRLLSKHQVLLRWPYCKITQTIWIIGFVYRPDRILPALNDIRVKQKSIIRWLDAQCLNDGTGRYQRTIASNVDWTAKLEQDLGMTSNFSAVVSHPSFLLIFRVHGLKCCVTTEVGITVRRIPTETIFRGWK